MNDLLVEMFPCVWSYGINSDIASMGYVYILFHTVIDTYLPWTWTIVVTPTSFTIFVNRTAFFILVVATTQLPISECSWKVDRALLGCISYQVILKYNTYELMYSSFLKTIILFSYERWKFTGDCYINQFRSFGVFAIYRIFNDEIVCKPWTIFSAFTF